MKTPSLPNFNQYSGSHNGSHTSLDPKNGAHLNIPKFEFNHESATHQDSNNSSINELETEGDNDHSNLSFIDMYGDLNSTTDKNNQAEEQESTPNQDSSKQPSKPEAKTKSIQSSRKQANKIRNSIESSRPSVRSNLDRYGFKKTSNFITESQYNNWWVPYANHIQRRKQKWNQLLLKNGLSLNDDNPQRFPARSEKLKRYVRKGIPAEWRGQAWWYFAKGGEYLQVGVYDQLVESTVNLHNKDSEIIERDLHRTFPDNVHFKDLQNGDESPLISSLRRVLKSFAMYQPRIGYCQSLNFICGLLLIFMDEEKAFWMLVIITTRYLPKVHEINLEGVNIDQGVLMLSMRNFLPEVWVKLSSIDFENTSSATTTHKNKDNQDFLLKLPPITLCTSSWFMSCFIGTLPIETTLRIWDCFIYEDSNFLFKISLSIFKLLETKIVGLKDEMEIFQIVQNFPKSLIDPSIIFDIIFKRKFGFNNLSQEEINRCRKYVHGQRQRGLVGGGSANELNNRSLLDESLWQPDLYGFRRSGLPGVHWNNNLTKRMRNSVRRK